MVIDDHRHIGNCEGRGCPTLDKILEDMEKKHIDLSVVCPSGAQDESRVLTYEESVREEVSIMSLADEYYKTRTVTPAIENIRKRRVDQSVAKDCIKRSGGKLRGAWFLCPWAGNAEFDDASDAIASGDFLYLKLHPQQHLFCPEDPSMSHVYDFARSIDTPVWFHASYGPGSEIRRITAAAKKFPGVKMVMGHGCVEPGPDLIDDIAEAFKCDNIFLELAHVKHNDFIKILEKFPHDRLIAGTDNPYDRYDTVFDHYLKRPEEFPCDSGSWKAILGDNAAKLYKIS